MKTMDLDYDNGLKRLHQCIKTTAVYGNVIKWAMLGSTKTPDASMTAFLGKNLVNATQKFGKCHSILTGLEDEWGRAAMGGKGKKNWSGGLGEFVVSETLRRLGHNIIPPRRLGGFAPDIETDKYVFEVKVRRYFMSGTASEKVLGVPYKYANVPELYGKPLKIVCVAYQEWVSTYGKDGERVFGDVGSKRQAQLDLWRSQGIEFVRFSEL